jgi:chaperonin GroES
VIPGPRGAVLFDKVLVDPAPKEEKTEGGIWKPASVDAQQHKGTVVKIGPGLLNKDGMLVASGLVHVGDTVHYYKRDGALVKLEGKEYVLLSERNLLFVEPWRPA